MKIRTILGPPGCGKTTRLMQLMEAALSSGVKPERIAFCSFTKAAVNEAKERAAAKFGNIDLPYFRTLHSMGYMMQGRPPLLGEADSRAFFETYGYRVGFAGDEDDAESRKPGGMAPKDQRLMRWWVDARRRSSSQAEAIHKARSAPLDVRHFIDRLESYKRETGRIDFDDMLLRALDYDPPDIDLMFLDEAQDLNPAQIALAERIAVMVLEWIIAGDDDQAIYRWQGAFPNWLQSLVLRSTVELLGQSYRLPRSVHQVSQAVVQRISTRVDKPFQPRPDDGAVYHHRTYFDAMDAAKYAIKRDRTVSFLGRTRNECGNAVSAALGGAVPYFVEVGTGIKPLQSPKVVAAAGAMARIQNGEPATAGAMLAILGCVKPLPHEVLGRHVPKLPKGIKTRLKEMEPDVVLDVAALGLGEHVDVWVSLGADAHARFHGLSAESGEKLTYLGRVLGRDGTVPDKALVITTQHRSKGREWDHVIVDASLSPLPAASLYGGAQDSDDEHRVAYVAVTRARHALHVLVPRLDNVKATHYPYPIEDVLVAFEAGA